MIQALKATMSTHTITSEVKFPVTFKHPFLGATRPGEDNFSVEIVNTPLLGLINAAILGSRVYELMTITRPGDCLYYLQVIVCNLDVDVITHVKEYMNNESRIFNASLPLDIVAFIDFDKSFRMVEDNQVFEQHWRSTIDGNYGSEWQNQLDVIFLEVLAAKKALFEIDDFLIQHEIKLIEEHKHCNAKLAHVPRINDFNDNLLAFRFENQVFYSFLESLIVNQEVKSVSCPFKDFYLWRILVKEQVKRSIHMQLAPQEAFYISGEDAGFDEATTPNNWGGYAHIPYEGMTCADCVFLPNWRKFFYDYAGANGNLEKATRL